MTLEVTALPVAARSMAGRHPVWPVNRFDARDCPVSTHSQSAIDRAEQAMWRMVSYYGDPLADLDSAIAADPAWPMPHVMKANVLLSMSEFEFRQQAEPCLARAAELSLAGHANDRERRHLAATRACAQGNWQQACRAWDQLLVDWPLDLVALHAAHLFDFFRGDARNLQRRVTRVLPAWHGSTPLYSFVLGMHAFGLEECNLYQQAREAGEAALAMEPRDPWAVHAITHVNEMSGEFDVGAAWLMARQADWAPGNAFAYHNWWHLALFQLEAMDLAAALALLDSRVMPDAELALQRVDVTALLWRLQLLGVDVGDRWDGVAEQWPAQAPAAGYYAFNDMHAMLALIGAGRLNEAPPLLDAVRERAAERSTLGMMAAQVGVPMLQGLYAYGRGRHDEAVRALWAARDGCYRFGGSHAQRDLVDQTLLDAALRAGERGLARHLVNERLLMKAHSSLTAHWAGRAA